MIERPVFITTLLRQIIESKDSEEQAKMLEYIDKVFGKFIPILSQKPDRTVMEYIGNWVEKSVAVDLECYKKESIEFPCKVGCSHCCYQLIGMSEIEARDLYLKVKDMDELDWDLLQEQSTTSEPSAYWELPKDVRKCTFLSIDEKCLIYAKRPLVCRLHYSGESDATKCGASSGVLVAKPAFFEGEVAISLLGTLSHCKYNSDTKSLAQWFIDLRGEEANTEVKKEFSQ